MSTNEQGTIYLLHFDPPLAHAAHYLGWSGNLPDRLSAHVSGSGSPLIRAATRNARRVILARIWEGTRTDERRLHNRHENPRLCPICQGIPTSFTALGRAKHT